MVLMYVGKVFVVCVVVFGVVVYWFVLCMVCC